MKSDRNTYSPCKAITDNREIQHADKIIIQANLYNRTSFVLYQLYYTNSLRCITLANLLLKIFHLVDDETDNRGNSRYRKSRHPRNQYNDTSFDLLELGFAGLIPSPGKAHVSSSKVVHQRVL